MRMIGEEIPELRIADPQDIQSVLKLLTYRERTIFGLRTGVGDGYRYTFAEIGHIFRISASRASQIHKRGRAKFLRHLAAFLPENQLTGVAVSSVIEHAKQLTPFLISHLKNAPHDIRLLPWPLFEHLIAEFFACWGYEDVRLVGRSAKTAADIFAMRKIQPDGTELRIFIETKRWKDRVGVEVIDRVYGAFLAEKSTFGWHLAMVVTVAGFAEMNKYSPDQLRLMGISLKDGEDIRKWLADYRFSEHGLWLPNPYKSIIGE